MLIVAGGAGLLTAACSVSLGSPAGNPPTASHSPASSSRVNGGTGAALQAQMEAIVKAVGDSVVQIKTPQGLGSGIVYDDRGDIVTNAHVVGTATSFTVTLSNGSQRQGTLVGRFQPDDLAVVRVDGSGLRPATLGDSSKLQVGDIVLAMGSPLGLQGSVTQGIVSALNRTEEESTGTSIPGMIQTSAPINPGNSGGALVDVDAQVIGIPTLGATNPGLGGGTAAGIGFAISSNMVKDIAGQLIASGKVTDSHRAYLGVTVADLQSGGVYVQQVSSGGPAEQAGIKSGDRITAVNAKPVANTSDLSGVLATLQPGQQVPVKVTHSDGSETTAQVTLGSFPGGS
jgi:putative serine protease PepD